MNIKSLAYLTLFGLLAPLSPAQEGDVDDEVESTSWKSEIREAPVSEATREALKRKYEAFVRCGEPVRVYLDVAWTPDNGAFYWCCQWAGRRLLVGEIAPEQLREMLTCPSHQYDGDTLDFGMNLRLEQEGGETQDVSFCPVPELGMDFINVAYNLYLPELHKAVWALLEKRLHLEDRFDCGIDAKDSPFVKAVKDGDAEKLAELLKAGADPNEKDSFGTPVLAVVAAERDVDTVRLLLDAGADVDAVDALGATALMYAGNEECVELLLKAGANPNKRTPDGLTPLMFFRALRGYWGDKQAVIDLLLQYGADPTLKDNYGMSAADYADRIKD